jgi:lysophospholipase L1-like esterase
LRLHYFVLPLLWLSAPASSQAVTREEPPTGAKPLTLRAVGRVEKAGSAQVGVRYRHEWPGVYFEGRFKGRKVYLSFDDATNVYRLWIDNSHPIEITQPGRHSFVVSALTDAEHLIRLEKITESIDLPEAFDGMFVAPGEQALPPPKQKRRAIEFIGDSGMTGYGIHSNTRTCSKADVHRLTDTQQAYPALVARHFDADYQVNAISGRGIIRNYQGTAPGSAITDLYPFTFFDKSVPYQDPSWKPQIVVIALGGNDVEGGLNPGEPWKSTDELLKAMFAAYARLIIEVNHRYPHASILVEWNYVVDDPHYQAILASARAGIAERARSAGIRNLVFASPPRDMTVDTGACDYHASLSGHRTYAAWLTRWLELHPRMWGLPKRN